MIAPQRGAATSAPPKVVHVVVCGGISGVERFLVSLATRPQLSGVDHCIALFTPDAKVRELFQGAGLKTHDRERVSESPAAHLWRTFGPSDIAWLARVLEEEKATCVHAHTFGSYTLAARAGLRCSLPVMRTEHGIAHYRDLSCAPFRRWTLRNTHRVIAVSHHAGHVVSEYDPQTAPRVRVIPNGIDLSHFHAAQAPPPGTFAFATVSRLVPLKQLHLAIKAIARLPATTLNIVGEGIEMPKLKALVRSLRLESRVVFHGFQSDPRPIVARSHAVINCSRTESLSLSLIEAAAMQRPAVAFAVGGTPEVVRNGHTGWLANECSLDSLTSAMKEAASDKARAAAFGVNAREWVKDKFLLDRMCRDYGRIYHELATAPLDAVEIRERWGQDAA
jgi:glycosyltransferase involved in cell wall biosynthesis